MAGIGLPLRRLLSSRSFFAQSAGYAYAGLAMAGPWLLATAYMQVVAHLVPAGLTPATMQSFQAIVLLASCGSMLVTGLIQLTAARHLSDRLFGKEAAAVVPSVATAAAASLLLHGAVGAAAIAVQKPPAALAVAEMALLGAMGLVSTGMIFLGVLQNVTLILAAFAAGLSVATALSAALAPAFGLPGLVGALAMGQGLIAAVCLSRLRVEFPASRPWEPGMAATMVRHPSLVLVGLALAGAAWIDKIVCWAGPWSVRSDVALRICPVYDNAFFFASFTALPALVLLFIRLEGSFHDRYARFYAALRGGADLQTIRRCRGGIEESFETTMVRVAVIQGMATLGAILLAPVLIDAVRLEWLSFYVVRAACLGAYLQALVWAVVLSAIHLALYRVALGVALVDLGVGLLGAWGAVASGPEFLGFGSVAAGGLALLVGYPWMRRALSSLERHTFMIQL